MEPSRSAQPQEVLLAEVRHRLANSFQLMAGLVRLRLNAAAGEEARGHLAWLLDAVAALGSLQQRLASAEGASFQAYLCETAGFWEQLAAGRGVTVAVEAVGDVAVPDAAATTLALIAHELVTNCVEHAFADGQAGRVTIRLGPDGDGRHGELAVRDDGRGFDGAVAPDGAATLGLSLVGLLARQLGGSFEIGAGEAAGTAARVRFPLPR